MIWGDEYSLRKWIVDDCDIFEYNEEVECDIRGSVMLIDKYATISCGEIKSSIASYSTAVKQMELRAKLIEFILHCVFGSDCFDIITKKGHLFVLQMISGWLQGLLVLRRVINCPFSSTRCNR
jgi:hypothetical protein